jgi:hypothetical protein
MALGLFDSNPAGYAPYVQRNNAVFRCDFTDSPFAHSRVCSRSPANLFL